MSNYDFNTAVVTGGGGGIGKAFAQRFIKDGKKVIIVGRTESNLKASAKEIGAAAYYVLDTGNIEAIPDFVKKLLAEHPDVDCLVNNAGVQRPLNVQKDKPEGFLNTADQEIDINIRGPLHLNLSLLEHFKSKPKAVMVNVSSVLGFIPFVTMNPVYCATKSWLHFWTISFRKQLEGTNVKVLELAPPTVATNLHRDREDPDDNKKEKNSQALSVDEFVDESIAAWKQGTEMITAGPGHKIVDTWEQGMGSLLKQMTS